MNDPYKELISNSDNQLTDGIDRQIHRIFVNA